MPFKSEKQRKWMHTNEPDMAKKWEKEEDVEEACGYSHEDDEEIEERTKTYRSRYLV